MSMVSVVMSTYNGEKYVGAQIESILKSDYQDFELFIYDDGSKDKTLEIVNSYSAHHPDKIHVYKNEKNLGVTRNFLQGLCRTSTDYVMFCDQDDVWNPNKILVTLNKMREIEAADGKDIPIAVFTDAQVVDKDLSIIQNSFFRSGRLNPYKTDLPHLLMENKVIGCTVMMNAALRKIVQKSKLPERAKLHDGWVALIASSLGRIDYLNQTTLLYRQHGGNVVGNMNFRSYMKNRILSLKQQKESILVLERQAAEFYILYKDYLSDKNKIILQRFSNLHDVNFLTKRIHILRYGFLKTGLIRNIGLMIIV
ncbi:glycosyltransferase family 2 protein [Mobilitalea sibirica]|uniref:Glycosyltransferase family 2 protein n=1 Tax=Mobilitalea sibirica TaxID=1462919 RepID=A0A8J7HDC1_9FIRM|nr:glycosyltransferase family 2 protein [Mobilitalea sibirica]MBH1940579.1 glycosyltransferase family 2 protein [Mobilitalea sibirica]